MGFLNKITIYYLVIIFLLFLYVLGIFQFGFQNVFIQFLSAVVSTTIVGAILDYIELKRWTKPITPFITGLIIGLVGRFGETPLNLALIGSSAMLIKFSLRWEGKHIFNPAASGLLVGILLLNSLPAWWGGEGFAWPFLIWTPILLYKMKRWAPIAGFLAPVILFQGLSIITSGSLLFFLTVMLIEPKTSPFSLKTGLIYGAIVGIFYLIFSQTSFDPLITSLLIGNLGGRLLGKYFV